MALDKEEEKGKKERKKPKRQKSIEESLESNENINCSVCKSEHFVTAVCLRSFLHRACLTVWCDQYLHTDTRTSTPKAKCSNPVGHPLVGQLFKKYHLIQCPSSLSRFLRTRNVPHETSTGQMGSNRISRVLYRWPVSVHGTSAQLTISRRTAFNVTQFRIRWPQTEWWTMTAAVANNNDTKQLQVQNTL